MVLMRRKDKRRGNESEEIIVASDSSIVANKGVRSLRGARTGRFAADMRVNVGGYGRADKTWGVDHPWHQTQSELFASMSSRDRMEDGDAVREEQRTKQQLESAAGASRAALKKKKAKLKKMGLGPAEAAAAALAEVEKAKQEAREAAAREQERREQLAAARRQKKLAKRDEDIDREIAEMARAEEALDEALVKAQAASVRAHGIDAGASGAADDGEEEGTEAAGTGVGKKRKRVNRNKKKKQKLAALAAGDAESDDAEESAGEANDEEAPVQLDATVAAALKKAKKEKRDREKKERKEALQASSEERAAAKQAEMAAREVLAKTYEAAAGSEVATKSGLVIRDARIGKGKLPDVGEICTVKYKGRLGKDGLVFGKGMLTTTYGTGSVIAGWEEGMGTMRPGGLRYLTIPPELGYGDSAKGGKIPANSTLYFEVELVRLGKRKREAVGKDEMPLPKAFQRKKIKEKIKHNGDESGGAKGSKPSKKRRRKHSV